MGFSDYKQVARKAHINANKRDANIRHRKTLRKQRETQRKVEAGKTAALQQPYLEIPLDMELTRDYFGGVADKRIYSETYADYFELLAKETGDNALYTIAENVRNCHKHWFGDHYGMQRVLDIKHVFCCHNKFCSNCEHLKQAARLARFEPALQTLRSDYDFYHMVLTVPNCPEWQLKRVIQDLLEAFRKLMRYFSGDSKVKGIDMQQYGYYGAVRCLECTGPDLFHPHIHALVILKKDLPFVKHIVNVYSYDRGIYKRSFSDLEELVQKMVFLIMQGKKVTAKDITALTLGYSCIMEKVDGDDWKEVFKYVTKLTKDGDKEQRAALTYDQFKALYYALQGVHAMQCYGKLYRMAKCDVADRELEEKYFQIIETLRLIEEPIDMSYALDELMIAVFKGQLTCISKRSVQGYLNRLAEEEQEKANSSAP